MLVVVLSDGAHDDRERNLPGATRAGVASPPVDFEAVFRAVPTACVLVDRALVIVDVNPSFERTAGIDRAEVVGVPLFEAFPENEETSAASGQRNIRRSLERVFSSGLPDLLPLQKYDIPDGAGGFEERWWSPVHVPVLDADGHVRLALQRVEDVTEQLRQAETGLLDRIERTEAELLLRADELRDALEAEARATRRLASLSDVAMQLAGAHTVEELTDIVIDHGVTALGSDGGAVAVLAGDDAPGGRPHLDLSFTEGLGDEARRRFARLSVDGPLPASVVTATGQRVLLPDRDTSLAYTPEMQEVVRSTGLEAWASLPLIVQGSRLGSLTVGWAGPHEFSAREVELLQAFAAQCAQALDRILARQLEREAAAQTWRMAEALQRSLLTAPPSGAQLDLAVRYLPAVARAAVGGDWYDAFVVPDGATMLVIGDVAGHDRNAAAAMGQTRNLLRGVAYTLGEPPAAVLRTLDRTLAGLQLDILATAMVARAEEVGPGAWTLTWANAGHPSPLLLHGDGRTELLERVPEPLLGLEPVGARSDHTVDLVPGDTVLLFTDGLVERRRLPLDVGLERLRATVERIGPRSADDLADAVLTELAAAPEDDIAMVVARIRDPGPPEG